MGTVFWIFFSVLDFKLRAYTLATPPVFFMMDFFF
jgi:hypothetical protein